MKAHLETFQINIGRFASLYVFENKTQRGRKVMTKVTKLNLKLHGSRKIFKVALIQVASFLLANCILIKFGKYVLDKGPWISSVITSNSLVMIVFIIIYVCVATKAKNTMYFVDMQSKICVKDERKIQYNRIVYSQSITQKIFGLCTLEFKNGPQKITLKDVSTESLKYLE